MTKNKNLIKMLVILTSMQGVKIYASDIESRQICGMTQPELTSFIEEFVSNPGMDKSVFNEMRERACQNEARSRAVFAADLVAQDLALAKLDRLGKSQIKNQLIERLNQVRQAQQQAEQARQQAATQAAQASKWFWQTWLGQ